MNNDKNKCSNHKYWRVELWAKMLHWCHRKSKLLFLVIITTCCIYILISSKSDNRPKHKKKVHIAENDLPLVLWWNAMPDDYGSTSLCDWYFCRFTTQRKHLAKAKASTTVLGTWINSPLFVENKVVKYNYVIQDTVLSYKFSTFSAYSSG